MKRYLGVIGILILLVIGASVLKVDVPVLLRGQGKNSLSLNGRSYQVKLRSPADFSKLSMRLLTFNRPANNEIKFFLYDDPNEKKLLRSHIVKKDDILLHGQYYDIDFAALKGGRDYYLKIIGAPGVPYILRYDRKQGQIIADGKIIEGKIAYKLYSQRTIIQIIIKAVNSASSDWFRLGYLYILAILAYAVFLATLLSTLIFRKDL